MRVITATGRRVPVGIGSTGRPHVPGPETLWALDGLRARSDDAGDGEVLFAGEVRTAAGLVAWQYGLPAEALLASDDGTSGQIYHHIRTLTAAGWLRSSGRGQVQVPSDRVVPLLVALATAL